jgi:hypothetical protein
MRNLIKRLINWAFARNLDVEFKTLGNTSCELNELKDAVRSNISDESDIEAIVNDRLDQYSNEFEALNNYDWDDFSQRLDNVQHLEGFSKDDFFDEIVESFSTGVQYKKLQGEIENVAQDLSQLNSSIEQTDEWFKSFLNATHEHFMQQAGSKD